MFNPTRPAEFMPIAERYFNNSAMMPTGRIVFATLSGSHLFGFPSPDSDFDVRGCWQYPTPLMLGLQTPPETHERSTHEPKRCDDGGMDLVLHEARKFINLMMKNGNAIEQIHSPYVLATTPEHEELKALSLRSITRRHLSHYFGFADQQRIFFERRKALEVKPLLYILRILMTAHRLISTHTVESNILVLNEEFKLGYVDELVQRKLDGGERAMLTEHHLYFYNGEIDLLKQRVRDAEARYRLPLESPVRDKLNRLLLAMREHYNP